jgi:hypothetical protein
VRAKHLVLLAALAALALPAQPAAARKHKPLPELELSSVRYTRYAFQGEPASQIQFCERTTNVGNAGTRRRLHNIMVLQGPSTQEFVARRDVPELDASGRRHGHVVHHSHYGCATGENTALNLPLGIYEVQICIDRKIKQRHGKSDCYIRQKSFSVIKRSWSGTVSGDTTLVPTDGLNGKQTWQVGNVTYNFASAVGQTGQFIYNLSATNVNYQFSGTSSEGCTATGGVTFPATNGQLKMDYANETYDIFGEVPIGSSIPITISCPNNSTTLPTPVIVRFVTNGLESGIKSPLPFGHTSLSGIFQNSSSGVVNYNDQWSLN